MLSHSFLKLVNEEAGEGVALAGSVHLEEDDAVAYGGVYDEMALDCGAEESSDLSEHNILIYLI